LTCSRLACRAGPGSCSAWRCSGWPATTPTGTGWEICALNSTLICDEEALYDPGEFNDRVLVGLKGTMSEAELHFIRARLRRGYLSAARRGELRKGLPVGL
jgi:hypothetical protein